MPANPASSPHYTRFLVGLCLLLAVLSVGYWAKGLMYLAVRPDMPNDLRLRWVDERYIFAGRNPYDVFFATSAGAYGRKPLWNARPTAPLPDIGAPENAGYPPWAFFAGAVFFWPGWPAVRIYYAMVNVVAGALIFGWAYGVGRPHGKTAAITLGFAFMACSANSTTLGLGQYGIVITALLAGALWLTGRRQPAISGVMTGLALTKPIITGPFCLPMLFRKDWKTIAGLAIYLAVADGVIWTVTSTNPIEMVLQMLRAGQSYMADSYGPMNLLLRLGMAQQHALALTAVGIGGIAALLMWLWCNAPLLVHFAIASVAGRLWTYHKLYDNIMVLFLLIALGELALRSRRAGPWMMFLVIGLTLWAPGKACDHVSFQIFQMAVWIAGVGILLMGTPRKPGQRAQDTGGVLCFDGMAEPR